MREVGLSSALASFVTLGKSGARPALHWSLPTSKENQRTLGTARTQAVQRHKQTCAGVGHVSIVIIGEGRCPRRRGAGICPNRQGDSLLEDSGSMAYA